jgi:hypothetical protein
MSILLFTALLISGAGAVENPTWPTCGEIQSFIHRKVDQILKTPDEVRLNEYLGNLVAGAVKTTASYGITGALLAHQATPLARAAWGSAYREAIRSGAKQASGRNSPTKFTEKYLPKRWGAPRGDI